MNKSNLILLHSILQDFSYLLETEAFPIWSQESEKKPDEFVLRWKSLDLKSKPLSKKPIRLTSLDKNFACKLCEQKLSGIPNFLKQGNFPVLILHYTGEYRKGQKAFLKRKEQIFRTQEAEEVMDRLLKKVFNLGLSDFYFQEFPACIFNQDISTQEDWELRLNNCWKYVLDSIEEFHIRGIILTGGAAVLKYGKQKALELVGKIQKIEVGNKFIPLVVLRSPEGILQLEEKRKKLELKKESEEYKKARKEEITVKEEILHYMTEFKNRLEL